MHNGSASEKVLVSGLELSFSTTDLLEKVFHPKREGEEWHYLGCYEQICVELACGKDKFFSIFQSLLESSESDRLVQYHQHEQSSYLKSDNSTGYKWELVDKESSFYDLVHLLAEKIFGTDRHETYLQHVLKKLLVSKARMNLRKNIQDTDLIIYSDFSKGLD